MEAAAAASRRGKPR